jgi:hypothetical protein
MNESHKESRSANLKVGVVLIIAGCLLLTDQIYLLEDFDWLYIFPGVIGLFGLIDVIQINRPEQIAKGLFNLILAFWIFASLSNLWGWTFQNSWPVILIAIGIRSLVAGLLSPKK